MTILAPNNLPIPYEHENAPIPYDHEMYEKSESEQLGFGETLDGQAHIAPAMTTVQKLKLVALIILGGLIIAGMIALLATGIGAAVAACIGSSLIVGMQIGAVTGFGLGVLGTLGIVLHLRRGANRAIPATNDFNIGAGEPARLGVGHANERTDAFASRDGEETAKWRHQLFREAKQSIEWSCNFAGGEIFRTSLGIIKENMENNPALQVRILCSNNLLEEADLKLLSEMQKEFPANFHLLVTTQKILTVPEFSTHENHVKMLAVDGKYFVTGGTGHHDLLSDKGDVAKKPNPKATFTSKGMGGGARDIDIIGSGETADTMRKEFYKLWAIWKYQMSSDKRESIAEYNEYFPLVPENPVAVLSALDKNPRMVRNSIKVSVCGGAHQASNACTKELIRMIDSAEKTIRLAQLSFNPTPAILDALFRAVNRGVDVELISNTLNRSSGPGMNFITPSNRQQYLPLALGHRIGKLQSKETCQALAANKTVKIFEYNLDHIMLHTKLVIVDGLICSTGSYNFGRKSHSGDYEMTVTGRALPSVEVPDEDSTPSLAQQCLEVFESIKASSRELNFDEVYQYRHNLLHRLYGKFMQWYVIVNMAT